MLAAALTAPPVNSEPKGQKPVTSNNGQTTIVMRLLVRGMNHAITVDRDELGIIRPSTRTD